MILLYLLAFLPAPAATVAKFIKYTLSCAPDEACIYLTQSTAIGGADYYEGVIERLLYQSDTMRNDKLELHFKVLSANELWVWLRSSKSELSRHEGPPGILEFTLNKIEFRFFGLDNMKVIEDGVNIATPLVIESAPGEPIRAHFWMKTKEPAYIAFEDLQVVWLNTIALPEMQWRQPKFAKKLEELTPCAKSPDLADEIERSDFRSTFLNGGRIIECAVDDKQLWIFTQTNSTKEKKIVCINEQWTAGSSILSSDSKIKCLEPIEQSCPEDLTKACADQSECHLNITPRRVSCPSKLRISRNWNSTFETWENTSEIFCLDGHWSWLPQNSTLGPQRIGKSKISCAPLASTVEPIYSSTLQPLSSTEPAQTLAQGALVWWLLGGTVSLFFALFLVIIVVCYFRNRTKKRRETGHCPTVKGISGSSKGVSASSKETEKALGVVRSSRETETPPARSPAEKWRIKWRSDSKNSKTDAKPSKEILASSRHSADKVSAEQISFAGAKGSADKISAEKVSAEQLSVTGQGMSRENFSRESQKE